MPRRAPPTFPASQYVPSLSLPAPLPPAFDWRQKGAVTKVKDQGTVGTCWAFSTTGNLEGQWFLSSGKLIPLSEEQLVDCDNLDCGVFGGWPYNAFTYTIQAGGIEAEKTLPYCCGTGECFPCMADKNQTFCGPPPPFCNRTCIADPSKFVANIRGWKALPKDEAQLQLQLTQIGPLSVCLDASWLEYYEGGVWDPLSWMCDPESLDHAVLIVGYGVEDTIVGKYPYWVVKNSWGADWGESGYFRITRGYGSCGINTMVTTAEV